QNRRRKAASEIKSHSEHERAQHKKDDPLRQRTHETNRPCGDVPRPKLIIKPREEGADTLKKARRTTAELPVSRAQPQAKHRTECQHNISSPHLPPWIRRPAR